MIIFRLVLTVLTATPGRARLKRPAEAAAKATIAIRQINRLINRKGIKIKVKEYKVFSSLSLFFPTAYLPISCFFVSCFIVIGFPCLPFSLIQCFSRSYFSLHAHLKFNGQIMLQSKGGKKRRIGSSSGSRSRSRSKSNSRSKSGNFHSDILQRSVVI